MELWNKTLKIWNAKRKKGDSIYVKNGVKIRVERKMC